MPVTFQKKRDQLGSYYVALIESPYGSSFVVDSFTPLECSVVHQNKRGKYGFGVQFTIKKNSKVLHAGTVGEAETLLSEIKHKLTPSFWKQCEEESY
jgi:hypothetical protein